MVLRMRILGGMLAVALLVLVAACSSSITENPGDGQTTSRESAAPRVASAVASCRAASPNVVTDIAGGLEKPATALVDARAVATTLSERTSGERARYIVAARIAGVPGKPVGLWAYGGSGIDDLNHVALTYSEWGTAAQPGSLDLKYRANALKYPETAKVLHCAKSKHGPTPTASRGANRCGFPQAPDVIYWFETPGQKPVAQRLGAYDYGNCTRTADQAQLSKSSPQGPGFCTIVASLRANPGYNFNRTPALKPNGILAEVGGAC